MKGRERKLAQRHKLVAYETRRRISDRSVGIRCAHRIPVSPFERASMMASEVKSGGNRRGR